MDEDNQSSENKQKPNEHERTSDDTATQLGCSEFDNGDDYQVTDEKSMPSTSHKNWYTSTLALKYLQPAFVPIVQDKISSVHDESVSQFGRQLCAEATAKDIEKSDGNMAKFKHKCDTEQKYTYACQTFLNIIKSHTSDSVDFFKMLQETDPQKWTKTPLDFVRLFLKNWMRCGIEDFKDCDISALCDIVKRFKPLMQMFDYEKIAAVKRVRNKTMHCAQMDLCQQDMEEHIEIILDFLNHIKSLKNTDDVTKAIDCIKQLKTGDVDFVHELVVDLITGCLPGARQEYLHRHAMAKKLHQNILYMEKELVRLTSGLEFCESIHTVSESEDVFEAKLLDDDSKLKAEIRKLKDEIRELKIQCRAARRNREEGRPGTPKLKRVLVDSVDIEWDGVDTFRDGDAYQVHIKNIETRTFDSKYYKVNSGNIGGLQPATPYVFKVRLVKDNGDESDYSENSDEVTTRKEPQQEANIPGKPYAESVFSDSVDIVWDGVSNFSEGDAYQVRIGNTQTGHWDSIFFENNRGKVGHLQPGATYVLKVRLVKANGEESKYSENSEEFKIKEDRPGKPITKRVFVDGVDIEWDGVRIFRDKDTYQVCITNPQTGKRDFKLFKVNSANIRGLLPGTTYVFKVRLVKGNGEESEYSENSDEVTTKEEPKTEANIPGKPYAERVFSDSVDIVWDGVSNFSEGDAYQVRIENTQTGQWDSKFFDKSQGNIGDLQPGATYVLKVRLVKANGAESKYSKNSETLTIKEETKQKKKRPGKPIVQEIYTDSVDIKWDRVEEFHKGDHYQVRVETVPEGSSDFQNFEISNVKINGLKPKRSYIFKVRWVKANGDESPYSEESDTVTTVMSFAAHLVRYSKPITTGSGGLDIYELPLNELLDARNEMTDSKKYEIGHRKINDINEKTIMLVGATGSGKSTFVDMLANYVLGVRLDDPFRFTVMGKTDREKKRDQAKSQTEIISCYSLNKEAGTRLAYRINIIDTPGFADVRGLDRDKKTVARIRQLFEDTGIKGIPTIDAVCFLLKAPDARLTPSQKYIFEEVTSLFARDISENLCAIITFADGMNDPPVLAAVNAEGLSFGNMFQFNNSALYSDPRKNQLISVYWDMGLQSLDAMFSHFKTLKPKSIQLSTEVLNKRHKLESDYKELQTKISQGLKTVDLLNQAMTTFKDNEKQIEANKNFTTDIWERRVITVDLPFGDKATNCSNCKKTCHRECWLVEFVRGTCWVIDWDSQYCTECKCHATYHERTSYRYDTELEKTKTTYDDMRKKYENAVGQNLNLQQTLDKMEGDIAVITVDIQNMLNDMNKCNDRLNQIALRPNLPGISNPIEEIIQGKLIDGKNLSDSELGVLKKISDIANGKVVIQDTVDKRPYWNYFNSL